MPILDPLPASPAARRGPRSHGGRVGVSAVAALAAVLIAGCEPLDATSSSSPRAASDAGDIVWTTTSPSSPAPATPSRPSASSPANSGALSAAATAALGTLATLPVKGRAPKTGYSRDLFGQSWTDDVSVAGGHNGCDTRNDILARDLTDLTFKPRTRDCVVLTGMLTDVYTNKVIAFQRGERTSSAVQIDHVVALSDAWQKGAQQLSTVERTDFANDPRNLQAVDGPANQQKRDSDAASWLPPNKSYRCTYVARQIEVKSAYRLWVTAAERAAMERVLQGCGGTGTAQESTEERRPEPRRTSTTAPVPLVESPRQPPAGGEVYYKNCAAARAAGAAPLRVGEPGYSRKLDRDGDGVACE